MSCAYQGVFWEHALCTWKGAQWCWWKETVYTNYSSLSVGVSVCMAVIKQEERPVTIQDTWRLIHRGLGHTTRISQSVLTVEDLETIDAGYYICTAQNLQGQTTVATIVEFSWFGELSMMNWWEAHWYPQPVSGCKGTDVKCQTPAPPFWERPRHPSSKEVSLLIQVVTFLFLVFILRKHINNFI